MILTVKLFHSLRGRFSRVTHPFATLLKGSVQLACVKPTASVHSEPGSNSI
uniref:Uncharacterized protein n=1 Tax=Auxenochlorella protothecoides TaxID=3075 RepID=A0A1Z1GBM4_AUXPR|nr:hypothetical protein BW920_0082 [Auxenochlorella protothecoides]